jgi:hypothetical protein
VGTIVARRVTPGESAEHRNHSNNNRRRNEA